MYAVVVVVNGERVYSNLIDITIPFFTIESIQKIN